MCELIKYIGFPILITSVFVCCQSIEDNIQFDGSSYV